MSDPGVVVPVVNAPSSLAALRSFGRRGVRTIAVSDRKHPPSFSSKYCDAVATVADPSRSLAAYEEALLELARRRDVDTILPFREDDVYVLARDRQAFADHVGAPWPALDALRNVQDRVRLFDAADAVGVTTPETEPLDEWEDWSREAVVKPRYTVHAAEYSDRFAESRSQSDSTRYVTPGDEPDRDALVAELGHVPIVQEYVPAADEYGFFALYDGGDAVATFQHRQRRGMKYCGGPSVYRESVDIPELEAVGLALLDELDWHGVAMVEFLRDPDSGAFKLMEVNPRFWSSLPFTVQAGVDFPALYRRQAIGEPFEPMPNYDVGVGGHLLRGELVHLLSILTDDYPLVDRPSFAKTVLDQAASLVRNPRFDYLDADDPRPFVRDLRNAAGELRDGRANSTERRLSGLRTAIQTLRARY